MASKKKIEIVIPEQKIYLDLADPIIQIRIHDVPEKIFAKMAKVIKPVIYEGNPLSQWFNFLAEVTMWLE